MGWLWTALTVLGILCLLVCLLPVQIHIRYSREGEMDDLWIQVRTLFGLVAYTLEIPSVNLVFSRKKKLKVEVQAKKGIGEEGRNRLPLITVTLEKLQRLYRMEKLLTERLTNFWKHMRKATKKFRITHIQWQTEFGTGDAALTGMTAGIVWSAKGIVLGVLSNLFSLRAKPHFAVRPDFRKTMLRTRIDCIIRFWVGQAIFAGIQMGLYMLREGKKSWQIIRSKA